MTTTIQRLDQTATTLNAVVQTCSTATSKSVLITSLSSAYRSLCSDISYLKNHEKRKYVQARSALIAVSNLVDGILQGLTNNELSKNAVRKAANTLENKFIPKFAEGLLAQAEAEQNSETAPKKEEKIPAVVRDRIKINISGSAEMREAYKVVVEASSTVGAEVTSNGPISELEAMAQQARALLPVKIPGDFKIVRVPIVPVFANFNAYKPEGLTRAGFKHVSLEGFVILKDQILLLVSRSKAQQSEVSPLALAYSVVDMLNDRGTVKYEVVSDVANANPRNTDLLMYWIMPSPKMSSLMKLLGNKGAANIRWGLPLPAANADADKNLIEKRRREALEAERRLQEDLERLAQEREAKERAKKAAKDKAKKARSEENAQRNVEHKARVVEQTKAKPAARPAPKPAARPASADKLRTLVDKHKKR